MSQRRHYDKVDMLIGQKLALMASQNGHKPAFKYLGQTTLFRDAFKYINRYSYFLQNEIMHNNRVLVYMSNCPHLAYTFFALANTKNVAVFADPSRPEMEIANQIRNLGISIIICSDDYLKRVQDLVRNNALNVKIIQCETRRWGEYDETYRLPPGMSASDKDTVAIFETSGTTGPKKLVPYTHTMVESACLSLKAGYRASPIDSFWAFDATLGHSFYFIHAMLFPLINGYTVAISDLKDPIELVPWLMENKVTRVIMHGQKIEGFFKSILEANLKYPLVRSITPYFYKLEKSVYDFIAANFNDAKILNAYGTTESTWSLGMTSFEEPESWETVGKFFATAKIRLVDIAGDDLKDGARKLGQVICSGPMVAPEYYNSKENTKMNMRGGWFFTGDWVEVGKRDVVTVLDRKENICEILGNTVVPPLVEAVFKTMDGVVDAAYIMMKEGQKKLVPLLVVQKVKTATISRDDVMAFADKHLKDYERPKHVAFVEEMPKNAFGMTDRPRLRFEYGGFDSNENKAA